MALTEKRFINENNTVISQEMIFARTQLFLSYNKLISRRRNCKNECTTVEEYKKGLIKLINIPFEDCEMIKSKMEDASAGKECTEILKILFGR